MRMQPSGEPGIVPVCAFVGGGHLGTEGGAKDGQGGVLCLHSTINMSRFLSCKLGDLILEVFLKMVFLAALCSDAFF